jgi:hypothetical protein
VGCLLCGKEIGPLQQLKEEEFCCSAHRKSYTSRLSKGIHLLLACEPEPHRAAPFASLQRIHENKISHLAILRFAPPSTRSPVARKRCPITITPVLGARPLRPRPNTAARSPEHPPCMSLAFQFSTRAPRFACEPALEDGLQAKASVTPPVRERISTALPKPQPKPFDIIVPGLEFAPVSLPASPPAMGIAASGALAPPRAEYARSRPPTNSHAAAPAPGIPVSTPCPAPARPAVRAPELALKPGFEGLDSVEATVEPATRLGLKDRAVCMSVAAGPIRPKQDRMVRIAGPAQAAPRLILPQPARMHPCGPPLQTSATPVSGSGPAPFAFGCGISEPLFTVTCGAQRRRPPESPLKVLAFSPVTCPPDFSVAPPAKPATMPLSIPAMPAPVLEPMEAPLAETARPPAGIIQLEYYSARVKSEWISDVKPVRARLALAYPAFRLSPLVAHTVSRKTRSNLRFIGRAQSDSPERAKWRTVAKVAAAGLLLGVGLLGGISFVSSHVRSTADAPAMADVRPVSQPFERNAPSPRPEGVLGRIRSAVSHRATAEIADNFEKGMQAWGAKGKNWPPGWTRHPDGYVRTGELALFRPSMTHANYHLEFMAQIEGSALGWVVHARDKQNYHAMKLRVVDPGLRPVVAIVHYSVVRGKPGKRVETPLSLMVHNNEPVVVAVEVKGGRVITSVEGQEVDSWVENEHALGGVGFFSEAGEHARLYWMKVAVNRGLLGTLCGYVARALGDGGQSTASAAPGNGRQPADWPLPQAPAEYPKAVLSAALGITGNRRNRRWVR